MWSYPAAISARYDDLMMMQRIQMALQRSAQGDVTTSSTTTPSTSTTTSSSDVSSIARHAAVDLESVGVLAGQLFAMLPPNDTCKQMFTNMLYFLLVSLDVEDGEQMMDDERSS